VLVRDEKNFVPICTLKFCNKRPNHVNLLLLSQGDKYHYVLVTSLFKLVAGRTKHTNKTFVCPYCLHTFSYQHCLDNHLPACGQHLPQTVKYPKERENILKFDKIQHMFPVPLFCMLTSNRTSLFPENTYPVVFAVCVCRNFPNMITIFLHIQVTTFFKTFFNTLNRNRIQSTTFFQPIYRSTL